MFCKMKRNLGQYFIEDRNGLLTLDVLRLMELSDEDFSNWRLSEMQNYFKNHGRNPTCSRCSVIIESPDNLVRYFGENLHSSCFMEKYKREKNNLNEGEQTYFDRVLSLIKNVPTRI